MSEERAKELGLKPRARIIASATAGNEPEYMGVAPIGAIKKALLDLQVAGEQLDDAAELAQPDDPLAGQVADVRDPVERQQMVHAQRVEGDRARHDQLVVAVVVGERGRPEGLGREQLRVGVGHPARRLPQPLGVDTRAQRPQQLARGALHGAMVDLARRAGA